MYYSRQIGEPLTATIDSKYFDFRLRVAGTIWALITVFIWGAWPAYTRLAVIHHLNPEDLVLLRYGIGGLLLLPVLIRQAPHMPFKIWREGIILAVFQGAPLAFLTTTGVRFTPASHLAALSPGLMPLFVAAIGRLFFHERVSRGRMVGLVLIGLGALAIAGVSLNVMSSGMWKGDALFVCACLMGSIYTLRMRRSGLSAIQGAALISVYSILLYGPIYLWFWAGSSQLTQIPCRELLFQAFYQGGLMGALTLFSLNQAIVLLGPARGAAFLSLDPVLGAALGAIVLHEIPSRIETTAVMAISIGVLLATGTFDRKWR